MGGNLRVRPDAPWSALVDDPSIETSFMEQSEMNDYYHSDDLDLHKEEDEFNHRIMKAVMVLLYLSGFLAGGVVCYIISLVV